MSLPTVRTDGSDALGQADAELGSHLDVTAPWRPHQSAWVQAPAFLTLLGMGLAGLGAYCFSVDRPGAGWVFTSVGVFAVAGLAGTAMVALSVIAAGQRMQAARLAVSQQGQAEPSPGPLTGEDLRTVARLRRRSRGWLAVTASGFALSTVSSAAMRFFFEDAAEPSGPALVLAVGFWAGGLLGLVGLTGDLRTGTALYRLRVAADPFRAARGDDRWVALLLTGLVVIVLSGVGGIAMMALIGLVVITFVNGTGHEPDADLAMQTLFQLPFMGVLAGGVVLVYAAGFKAVGFRAAVPMRVRALAVARDAARTSEEIRAVQAVKMPGRVNRRWLPGLWFFGLMGVVFVGMVFSAPVLAGAGFALVLVIMLVAPLLGRRKRKAAEAVLAANAVDLAQRATEIAGVAQQYGWQVRVSSRGKLSCTGGAGEDAFTLTDRIRRDANGAVTGARTVVSVAFPTVFQMRVVRDALTSKLEHGDVGDPVELESGEFNDKFDVYSPDPVRARLVLNPAVMAALLTWGQPVEVLVADSKIEMSVPHTLVPSSQVPHFVALAVSVARSARAAVVEPEDGVPPQAGVLGVPSLNQDHLTARMHLSNLEA